MGGARGTATENAHSGAGRGVLLFLQNLSSHWATHSVLALSKLFSFA
jgi:hypothetical protein